MANTNLTFADIQRDIIILITGAVIALLIVGVDVSRFAAILEPIS